MAVLGLHSRKHIDFLLHFWCSLTSQLVTHLYEQSLNNHWATSYWNKAGLDVMSLCSKTLLILKRTPPASNTHFLLEGCVHIKSKSIRSSSAYFTQSIHIFTSPCFYGNKWVIHSQEVVGFFTVYICTHAHILALHTAIQHACGHRKNTQNIGTSVILS